MNDKPAFPRFYYTSDDNDKGMTLREWYAGMALQGMLSNEKVFPSPDSDAIKWVAGVTHNAHMFADAMIEASDQKDE